MQERTTLGTYKFVTISFILLLLFIALWIQGAAVVVDRSKNVVTAVLTTSSGTIQPLAQLPGRVFFAIPQIEGTIEVRCNDGSRAQMGYVTRHNHSWFRLDPGVRCGGATEIR
jgi:hypothetical protein